MLALIAVVKAKYGTASNAIIGQVFASAGGSKIMRTLQEGQQIDLAGVRQECCTAYPSGVQALERRNEKNDKPSIQASERYTTGKAEHFATRALDRAIKAKLVPAYK